MHNSQTNGHLNHPPLNDPPVEAADSKPDSIAEQVYRQALLLADVDVLNLGGGDGGFTIGFCRKTVTPELIGMCLKSMEDRFPPVLTLEQAADLVQLEPQTLRAHLSEGKYKKSSRRGHPVRFWRDVFVIEYMQGGLR